MYNNGKSQASFKAEKMLKCKMCTIFPFFFCVLSENGYNIFSNLKYNLNRNSTSTTNVGDVQIRFLISFRMLLVSF